jgi:hypothetical protein
VPAHFCIEVGFGAAASLVIAARKEPVSLNGCSLLATPGASGVASWPVKSRAYRIRRSMSQADFCVISSSALSPTELTGTLVVVSHSTARNQSWTGIWLPAKMVLERAENCFSQSAHLKSLLLLNW